MAEESDGIEEAFEGQMRVIVMTAARAGEMFARAREDAKRRAQQLGEREARELQSRLDAERQLARTQLSDVHRDAWWESAKPDEIGHRFQTARAWASEDPQAARAEQRMREEIATRYKIQIPTDGRSITGSEVANAVQQSVDVDQADIERERAQRERAEAVRLGEEANRDDVAADQARAAAEHEPDPADRAEAEAEARERETNAQHAQERGKTIYDSAERRNATASELEAHGIDPDAINARMHADVSNAKPASAAVTATGKKASHARKAGSPQVQRSGLNR